MSIMDDAKDDAERRKQASQHMRELEEGWREKVRSLVSPELPKILAILEGVKYLEPEFRFLELTARQEVKFYLSESIDLKLGLPLVPRFLWDSHHRIKVYTCRIDLSLVGGLPCMVNVLVTILNDSNDNRVVVGVGQLQEAYMSLRLGIVDWYTLQELDKFRAALVSALSTQV